MSVQFSSHIWHLLCMMCIPWQMSTSWKQGEALGWSNKNNHVKILYFSLHVNICSIKSRSSLLFSHLSVGKKRYHYTQKGLQKNVITLEGTSLTQCVILMVFSKPQTMSWALQVFIQFQLLFILGFSVSIFYNSCMRLCLRFKSKAFFISCMAIACYTIWGRCMFWGSCMSST